MTPVWCNGGRLRVGQATTAEVDLFKGIVPGGVVKASLSRWMLLSLLRPQAGGFSWSVWVFGPTPAGGG